MLYKNKRENATLIVHKNQCCTININFIFQNTFKIKNMPMSFHEIDCKYGQLLAKIIN